MRKPQILYKYRPANGNTLKIFRNRKIWAPTLRTLNDPFDGNILFSKDITEVDYIEIVRSIGEEDNLPVIQQQRMIDAVIGRDGKFMTGAINRIHQDIDSTRDPIDKLGVICLSEHADSMLMWTHYCSEHKGICIGFDMTELHNDEPDSCLKMTYQSQYPRVTIADVFLTKHKHSLSTIWTKAADWSYEDEWRYVVEKGDVDVNWPGNVREIIFGLNSEPEFENEVKDLVRGYGVVFKKARLSSSSYKILVQ